MGHSLLSNPAGGYAEGDVRDDGRYALLGSFLGEGGSFLVDVRNPRNPTEVHRLPSDPDVRNADVKFDTRDGLYYRSQEPNTSDATFTGAEIVDYGFADGTPEDPAVLASIESGPTHNLTVHPNAPVLYTVNHDGFDVVDVSDPTNPTVVGTAGRDADLHDVVIDPESELGHFAYIGGGFGGYVIMDMSDPTAPYEVGHFDYSGRPSYEEIGLEALKEGTPGFGNCHFATYDPERGIAVVGDEIATGTPGGKHVFDIGWGDGSPSDPQHVGFTLSPNAAVQGGDLADIYDWTGHNFSVIPKGETTLLVSGDYHEGTVVYDVTDPTDPTATDRYRTDDGATEEVNDDPIFDLGDAPMAWGADWNERRDVVVTSDFFTGVYVFKVTPAAVPGGGNGGN
ncbi:MAG: LVIVD repeat-containing protein [Halanaeroarchaeum sp.]